jgi:hypothetical protein
MASIWGGWVRSGDQWMLRNRNSKCARPLRLVWLVLCATLAACQMDTIPSGPFVTQMPVGCGPGAGIDTFVFDGVGYTENIQCTTVASAYHDSAKNSDTVDLSNNLFGIGSGYSLEFLFSWTGSSTGPFVSAPILLFYQKNGTFYLCDVAVGAVLVTRRDAPGGRMVGTFSFAVLNLPVLCEISSLSGSFDITREPDK